MLKKTILVRKFKFNGQELTDINPALSPEDVMETYSNTYPELVNAYIKEGKTTDKEIIYEFVSIAGTKG